MKQNRWASLAAVAALIFGLGAGALADGQSMSDEVPLVDAVEYVYDIESGLSVVRSVTIEWDNSAVFDFSPEEKLAWNAGEHTWKLGGTNATEGEYTPFSDEEVEYRLTNNGCINETLRVVYTANWDSGIAGSLLWGEKATSGGAEMSGVCDGEITLNTCARYLSAADEKNWSGGTRFTVKGEPESTTVRLRLDASSGLRAAAAGAVQCGTVTFTLTTKNTDVDDIPWEEPSAESTR